MSGLVQFNRTYAQYGPEVRTFENSTDVSVILSQVICEFLYPLNALIGQNFSAQWLGEGEKGPNDPEDLDLIFRFSETEISTAFFEIVLRDSGGTPMYGGWLIDGKSVEISDEIVNGYRVINVVTDSETVRHEHDGNWYLPVSGGAVVSALIATRRGKPTPRWD